MVEMKLGQLQNELFGMLYRAFFNLGFAEIEVGEKDGKLYFIAIPKFIYMDVVNKYNTTDIKYLINVPNESDLSDKNNFLQLYKMIVAHFLKKMIGDARMPYEENMDMAILGIDPGNSGAIAVLYTNKDAEIYDMPIIKEKVGNKNKTIIDLQKLHQILLSIGEKHMVYCFIENVHAMPSQGVTSMFNFGKGFGALLGLLEGLNIHFELISPQKWKKHFNIKKKEESVEVAFKYVPNVEYETKRGRILDGRGDAVCIALYGKSQLELNASE